MLTQSWRPTVRYSAAVLLLILTTSCGGNSSPTGPSAETSFLSGRWTGTLTISRDGEPDVTGPTTWTFTLNPGSSRLVFQTAIESQNPWLPLTLTTSSAIRPSADPPTQIVTNATYTSPRGCRGDFGSEGDAQGRTIDASFSGVDCVGGSPGGILSLQAFQGRVRLTKQ